MTMGFFGPGDLRLLGVPGCGRFFLSLSRAARKQ